MSMRPRATDAISTPAKSDPTFGIFGRRGCRVDCLGRVGCPGLVDFLGDRPFPAINDGTSVDR
eukprot:6219203-Pyramimonas_sp.AAC.1